jgi:hypothetical protein
VARGAILASARMDENAETHQRVPEQMVTNCVAAIIIWCDLDEVSCSKVENPVSFAKSGSRSNGSTTTEQ